MDSGSVIYVEKYEALTSLINGIDLCLHPNRARKSIEKQKWKKSLA